MEPSNISYYDKQRFMGYIKLSYYEESFMEKLVFKKVITKESFMAEPEDIERETIMSFIKVD